MTGWRAGNEHLSSDPPGTAAREEQMYLGPNPAALSYIPQSPVLGPGAKG